MPDYSILYEDDSILIIDKPQGIPTSPGLNNSICDIVFNNFQCLKDVRGYVQGQGGLLNRLDNETGGIVLFAKNNTAFKYYSDLLNKKKVEKRYTAVVDGVIEDDEGIINIPIAHHPKNKKKMIAVSDKIKHFRSRPRQCETLWKKIKTKENFSLFHIKIYQGMRHQIRVHLSFLGYPVVGDKLYNKKNYPLLNNHLLYASGIHLISVENKEIEIDIKDIFEDFFD